MKTLLSLITSLVVLTGFMTGCAESGSMKKEPTGAPMQNPKKMSGSDTGGAGGPR